MTLSVVFGDVYEVDAPMEGNVRNYNADGRHFIGHSSYDISHVCDRACLQSVIEESGPWTQCTNNEDAYVATSAPCTYTDGTETGMFPSADVHDFDPGDDPYILCAACETVLLRDDEKYEEQYGRKIGERP